VILARSEGEENVLRTPMKELETERA